MGFYAYAIHFWSLVTLVAVAVPLVWAVARETVKAIAHLRQSDEGSHPSHPSLVSFPSNPRPSGA